MAEMVRMTWMRRLREDARAEFTAVLNRIRWSRTWRQIKMHTSWRVEGWLLSWTEDTEPADRADLRFLAQDEDGDFLMPRGYRGGEPWWQGYWRWWRPDHWPVYVRSRRARTWVMVERLPS